MIAATEIALIEKESEIQRHPNLFRKASLYLFIRVGIKA